MTKQLTIGMIGIDTSHCTGFAELLNLREHPYHVPGGRLAIVYKGGSPDLDISRDRVEGYTQQLQEQFAVEVAERIEEVAERADAIMLTSVDGRVHPQQFAAIAKYGKPVFIDKPFAVSSADARYMIDLAKEHGIPMFSSSSLRFARCFEGIGDSHELGEIFGVDCYGPMALQPSMPGLFWYGIHIVEMMMTVLGPDCVAVTAMTNEDHDIVTGEWSDGRFGTMRGNRKGNYRYGCMVHREKGSQHLDVSADTKPYYAGLIEQIMAVFQSGVAPIDATAMMGVVRFIEAANESRATGKRVLL
ncbi:MAG: Gfo/Idh/MocA family oxidoreductase [Paenibacillaceae bacterium]|nr:Gfo/Idh/MocA family oxidoreductase [Paenibacillaceae bacterium]